MRQLPVAGKVVELTERDFLDLVAHQAKGNYFHAMDYITDLLAGFPFGLVDIPEPIENEVTRATRELLQQVEAQIDDKEMRESYNYLKKVLEELGEIDRRAVDWLAAYVGLPPVRDNRDKRKLLKRLHPLTFTPEGQPQGPVWAMDPEYQAIVQKVWDIWLLVEQSKQQFDQCLRRLLAQCPEEPPSEIPEEVKREAIRQVVSALPRSMQRLVLIEGEPYEIWARRGRKKPLP